jgi:hypothetical protein
MCLSYVYDVNADYISVSGNHGSWCWHFYVSSKFRRSVSDLWMLVIVWKRIYELWTIVLIGMVVTLLLIWQLLGACVPERNVIKSIHTLVLYGFGFRGQAVSIVEDFLTFRQISQPPSSRLFTSVEFSSAYITLVFSIVSEIKLWLDKMRNKMPISKECLVKKKMKNILPIMSFWDELGKKFFSCQTPQ